eukprot:g2372.t1
MNEPQEIIPGAVQIRERIKSNYTYHGRQVRGYMQGNNIVCDGETRGAPAFLVPRSECTIRAPGGNQLQTRPVELKLPKTINNTAAAGAGAALPVPGLTPPTLFAAPTVNTPTRPVAGAGAGGGVALSRPQLGGPHAHVGLANATSSFTQQLNMPTPIVPPMLQSEIEVEVQGAWYQTTMIGENNTVHVSALGRSFQLKSAGHPDGVKWRRVARAGAAGQK